MVIDYKNDQEKQGDMNIKFLLFIISVEDGNEKKRATMGRILGTITEDDGSKSHFLYSGLG